MLLTTILFYTRYQGLSCPVVMESHLPLKQAGERGARYLAASGHTNIAIQNWKASLPDGLTSNLCSNGAVMVLNAAGECVQYQFPPLNADLIDDAGQIRQELIKSAKPIKGDAK